MKAGTTTIGAQTLAGSVTASPRADTMISKVTDKAKDIATAMELAKQAPTLLIFAIFAIGTLWFMERRDAHWTSILERGDKVADLRIEQCHAVQIHSAEASESFSKALAEQSLSLRELTLAIRALSQPLPPYRHPSLGSD